MAAAKLDIKALKALKRTPGKNLNSVDDVKGVVYGRTQESIPVLAKKLDLERIYNNLGHSSLFNLELEGESEPINVLLHEVQMHPNTNQIIHFDLYAVTKGQKVQTDIAIHFEGEPGAQADAEKAVSTVTDVLEIQALPQDLPDQITLDISDLNEVGDQKLVSDIKLPSNVEVLTDPETVIIKVDQARTEEEEPEEPDTGSDEEDETDSVQSGTESDDQDKSEEKTE